MHVSSREEVQDVIHTPTGERIVELIGGLEASGGASQHSLAEVVVPPGKSSEPHFHQTAEETYYLLQGAARMVIDGEEFGLEAGQACLIEPGEVHQIFNEGEDDLVFLAVCAPPWTDEDSFPA
jgi:mannose-6-phosphate isomerase-like protein (cupin superfamily)